MEHKVRIERIKKTPTYDAAFDHLTNFYKRRKISHDRDDAVVDLTGDDEDLARLDTRGDLMEKEPSEYHEEAGDGEGASGDPCK
jgi:hypothetical protein